MSTANTFEYKYASNCTAILFQITIIPCPRAQEKPNVLIGSFHQRELKFIYELYIALLYEIIVCVLKIIHLGQNMTMFQNLHAALL
jgi:hypothetical protein